MNQEQNPERHVIELRELIAAALIEHYTEKAEQVAKDLL